MLVVFAKSIASDDTIAIVLTYLFNLLFFLTPLIFWPRTSEVFELNKMLFVYAITVLIVVIWLAKMVVHKKFIFRRTIMDIPLLIFLSTQIISTFISIDTHTSVFGYYSRFHGGLLSSISYSLLYWAFVSNMDLKKVKRTIFWLLAASLIVSIYGIFEHFGASPSCLVITKKFNTECWVQDVQLRVFATIGQPNWMAAYLTAIVPISWWLTLKAKFEIPKLQQIIRLDLQNSTIWLGASTILFIAILFTKSRSGLLGFAAAFTIFWGLVAWVSKKKLKNFAKSFLPISAIYLLVVVLVGTPWTPNLIDVLSSQPTSVSSTNSPPVTTGTVLETGGTESGDIRKIVWNGAIEITKSKPLFGTGLETFAFSYYQFRPEAHNLVSEWDFLYNKAHNEFLNVGANSGLLGLLSLGTLIVFSIYVFTRKLLPTIFRATSKNNNLGDLEKLTLSFSLLAGFISILVTNFFGFSVVPVALLSFLFPAIAFASYKKEGPHHKIVLSKLAGKEKAALFTLLFIGGYILLAVFNYWRADLAYAKGRSLRRQSRLEESLNQLVKAAKIRPNEPIYLDELSRTQADLAVTLAETDGQTANLFVQQAISNSDRAFSISPRNINLRRSRASTFLRLSRIDENYLLDALQLFLTTVPLAPTDPKILYQMGLTLTRAGQLQQAIEAMKGAIDLKPDYKDARFALGLLYEDREQPLKAIEHYEYILTNIAPDDQLIQQQLDELKKP